MCRAHVPVMLQQRFKKKKAASNEEEAKESDDEESDEEKDPAIGYETVEVKVASLQADLVARGLFKMTRERAMHLISEGLIRLNDRKTIKNDLVTEFDTLDYIRGRNKENPDLLDIARAQVVYVPDISSTMGRSKIKAHIWRFITIENYKEEPYTGHVQSTQGDEEESNERFK